MVGGGPAGLACALELRRRGGLSVAVVERTDYGAPRFGETLAAAARPLLAHLGLWDDFQADGHLPAYGTAAAWGSDDLGVRDFLLTPQGAGWNLDRKRFDTRMAEVAEARGVALLRRSRPVDIQRAGEWLVGIDRGGVREVHAARFLVDATGRSAALARRLGAQRRRLDRQVAVVTPVACPTATPFDHHTLVEACDIGWWYSVRLPPPPSASSGVQVMAALVSDADLVRERGLNRPAAWSDLLRGMRHTGVRLQEGRATAPPRLVTAHSAWLTPVETECWLAVGDAAASHDPLSASGIVRALDGGIRAALAIDAWLVEGRSEGLKTYGTGHRQDFERYAATRARYYQLEQRWPKEPFWRRRQRHVTLDARAWLQRRPHVAGAPPLPSDLGPVRASDLLAGCAGPHPAHEIVAEHRRRFPTATDLDVILGLQWLLQSGALEIVPDPSALPRRFQSVP